MKHRKLFSIAAIALLITALSTVGCKKNNDNPAPAPTTGNINIVFTNMVGDTALVLDTKTYTNASSEKYTVSLLNYYVSNIKLTRSDNMVYVEKESYHLIQTDDASSFTFTLSGVPYGNYTTMTFTIGVDSTRNISGAQTGALDVKYGMFWTWNSGYIMTMLNGKCQGKSFEYHIGGFSGPNSVLKTLSLPFVTNAIVSGTVTPSLQLKTDVAKWFDGPNKLSIVNTPSCTTPGALAKSIADNYANAFSITQVKNN